MILMDNISGSAANWIDDGQENYVSNRNLQIEPDVNISEIINDLLNIEEKLNWAYNKCKDKNINDAFILLESIKKSINKN